MNQILSTEINRRSKSADLKRIRIIFAVCIIVFGICVVSGASYAIHKSNTNKRVLQQEYIDTPTQQENPGQQANPSDNENTVVPNSVNESNIEIKLEAQQETKKIKATVSTTSETDNIEFVTYKFDDGDETREDINAKNGELEIDIPEGEHILTVIAVDTQSRTETVNQKVIGATGPKVDIQQDGTNFIISVTDDIGLNKIEVEINGEMLEAQLNGEKERQFLCPMVDGENTLIVTVYNVDGIEGTKGVLCRK